MKVIALIGSPRKGGNSDILVNEVLRGARNAGATVEKVYLDDLNIRPIGAVDDVLSERLDTREDDDFPEVLGHFLDADIAILSTPVYWQGVSAQMKCFIDRLSSYFRRPPYAERFEGKGYLVVCTFGREDPTTGDWVTGPMKATVDVLRGRYLGDLSVSVYQKGRVKQDKEALEKAYRLGKNAVETLRSRKQ